MTLSFQADRSGQTVHDLDQTASRGAAESRSLLFSFPFASF